MKISLDLRDTESIKTLSTGQIEAIQEIVGALISSGGLTGVRGGQTAIHFDQDGIFQKVELRYFPWQRRHK